MELNIQIKNNLNTINFSEIKLFMELYHLLNHIYFYYSNISIFCNEKNILFNQQLFFNLNNVSIVNIKYNKNCFIYKTNDDLIQKFSTELNKYSAQVNSEVQEYSQNLNTNQQNYNMYLQQQVKLQQDYDKGLEQLVN